MVRVEISDLDMSLKEICQKLVFLQVAGFEPYFEISPSGSVKIVFVKVSNVEIINNDDIEIDDIEVDEPEIEKWD